MARYPDPSRADVVAYGRDVLARRPQAQALRVILRHAAAWKAAGRPDLALALRQLAAETKVTQS